VAKLLRVGRAKVRRWVESGELAAVDVAGARCGRAQLRVLPDALAAFLRGRQAAQPPQPRRMQKRMAIVDYYPD
jgi:excisionase family DNA binding protein